MKKWTLGGVGKTNPIQTQYEPNSNPIQSQFKPKQTQSPRTGVGWMRDAPPKVYHREMPDA